MVWKGDEGPEGVVERDVDPRVAESTIGWGSRLDRVLGSERTLARPRDPWLEDDGGERNKSGETVLAQPTDVGEKGGKRLICGALTNNPHLHFIFHRQRSWASGISSAAV